MVIQKTKAWRLHQFNIEHLQSDDVELPDLGANDLLIKVKAASVNYRDKAIIDGSYNPELLNNGPVILGSDASGIVVSRGEAVTRFKEGDHVITHVYTQWLDGDRRPEDADHLLGYPLSGVLSEYIVINEEAVVAKPAYLTYEEASTLPIAALTAWTAVKTVGKIEKGQSVFIQGTGGVALFALQIASKLGANVIVSTSRNEKGEKVKAIGADHFVNYTDHPDWEQEVLRLTNGKGVDEIIELVAGDITKSTRAIKFGGTIAVVGFLGKPELTVNVFSLFGKQPIIEALSIGHRRAFEEMNIFFEEHQIKPVIDRVYGFGEVQEAFSELAKGPFGKIVIKM